MSAATRRREMASGWLLVAACAVIMAANSVGFLALGMSVARASSSSFGAIQPWAVAGGCVVGGWCADRLGPRKVAMSGLATAGIGFLTLGSGEWPSELFLLLGLALTFALSASTAVCIVTAICRNFDAARTMAIAYAYSGGALIVLFAAVPAMQLLEYDPANYRLLGGGGAIIGALAAWSILPGPGAAGSSALDYAPVGPAPVTGARRSSGVFMALLLAAMLGLINAFAGAVQAQANVSMALQGLASMTRPIIFIVAAHVAVRFGEIRALQIAIVIAFIAAALMASNDQELTTLTVLLGGASGFSGAGRIILLSLSSRFSRSDSVGLNAGAILAATSIVATFAPPMVAGLSVSAPPVLACFVVGGLAVAVSLRLPRLRSAKQAW